MAVRSSAEVIVAVNAICKPLRCQQSTIYRIHRRPLCAVGPITGLAFQNGIAVALSSLRTAL